MGVVDIFKLQCPHCGNIDETSTKAAENPCCDRYWPHDAPEEVLADIAKDNPYGCVACGELYILDTGRRLTTPLFNASRAGLVTCELVEHGEVVARIRLAAVPRVTEVLRVDGVAFRVFERTWEASTKPAKPAKRSSTVGHINTDAGLPRPVPRVPPDAPIGLLACRLRVERSQE